MLGEELAQAVVEGRRGLARHGVVGRDRAALLDDLAGRIETDDALEARAVEVPLRGGDILLERGLGRCISFDDGHGINTTAHDSPIVRNPPAPGPAYWLLCSATRGGCDNCERTVRVSSSARISGWPANRPSSACAATTAGSTF